MLSLIGTQLFIAKNLITMTNSNASKKVLIPAVLVAVAVGLITWGISSAIAATTNQTVNTIGPQMMANGASNIAPSAMNMNSSSMSSMLARGNTAMGFNQSKIMHHFIATPTGGEIMIVALNSSDNDTIKQIRNHVLDIQNEFSQGNFTKPFFIHAQQVPGTKLMGEKKDLIRYSIKQINNGSVLLLTTNDQQLIVAIHQFIAFQTAQHSGH